MKNMVRKMVCAFFIFSVLVSMLGALEQPVLAATSGVGYGGSITVTINNSLHCRRGKQYAVIKVRFQNNGGCNNAKVHVLMLDENYKWVCEYDINSNRVNTFRLGDDHRVYRIYFNTPSAAQRYTGLRYWNLTYRKDCSVR